MEGDEIKIVLDVPKPALSEKAKEDPRRSRSSEDVVGRCDIWSSAATEVCRVLRYAPSGRGHAKPVPETAVSHN